MTAAQQEQEQEQELTVTQARHRARLLRMPKTEVVDALLRFQSEERTARKYPWPPRSPAARLQRRVKNNDLPADLQADITAVLHTYGLLVQIAKRGETHP